jgi:hypothetical protein
MSFFIRALFNLWVLLSLLPCCPSRLNHHQFLLHDSIPLVRLIAASVLTVAKGILVVVGATIVIDTVATQGLITVGSMVLPLVTRGKVIGNRTKGITTPNSGPIHTPLGRMSGASYAIFLVIQCLNTQPWTTSPCQSCCQQHLLDKLCGLAFGYRCESTCYS